MSISLRRLRYFRTIVAEGSFTAAASRLGIAQPALSQTIAQLEDHYGQKLLDRSRKGVSPTPEGLRVLDTACMVLDNLAELDSDLRDKDTEPVGDVSIALAVTLARQIAPRLLTRMAARYPKVNVTIEVVASTDAVKMLETRQIDCAIVPPPPISGRIATRPLYRESICLIALARSVVPDTSPIRFRDLPNVPLVQSSAHYDLRRRLDALARELGVALDLRFEQDNSQVMLGIVMAGLAATATQVSIFHPTMERPLLDIHPIIEPRISRTHMLCRMIGNAQTAAQTALEAELLAAIRDLTADETLPGEVIEDGAWSDGPNLIR